MSHFTIAILAKSAAAAVLACAIVFPAYAQTRVAADKLDSDKFEKQLQDTRDDIKKERTTTNPSGAAHTNQTVIDICKKNPQLPQCKL